MHSDKIAEILQAYKAGAIDLQSALTNFQDFPLKDLGFAQLDSQRQLRTGFPEVVYAAGKTPDQLCAILKYQISQNATILATRASPEHWQAVQNLHPDLAWNPLSRTISLNRHNSTTTGPDYVAVICAGTSDLPVAEEAAITVELFGFSVHRISDVGVAGLHRLLGRLDEIRQASVIIAVAGMEGALPSVLGGLVSRPIIAVPTSIGYGASFGGLSALLTMLNSCSAGISVVNIDNGFGAGYQAGTIMKAIREGR